MRCGEAAGGARCRRPALRGGLWQNQGRMDEASPLVAIIIDAAVPYDREIATGVAQYAREAGDWRLYIEEEAERRIPRARSWNGQGVIASFDDKRITEAVVAMGLPTVAVGGGAGYHDPATGIPYVETDNETIARLAAEHLLDRGLGSFGFYGLPASVTNVWSQARAAAFERHLAAAGRPCRTLTARHESREWDALQRELAAWLGELPKPAGILACDDLRARHVLEACRRCGLRVPYDVAVIGVDDDEFICELAEPPLSSIAQSARRIGHEAARLLDGLMRSAATGQDWRRDAAGRRVTVPPARVVARRSTETIAVADPLIAEMVRAVREQACANISIAELVKRSGLSRWVLEDRFKRAVGHSIHDDILRVKLAEARRLVMTTELPLKAIAPRAGFRSVSYMTTLFSRHLGSTPAALRKLAGRSGASRKN